MMDLSEREIVYSAFYGFRVGVDVALGHLWVEHDGTLTWEQLQAIKTMVWGRDARAIEVYPADDQIVNNLPMRHLWRLGAADFAPDLLGHHAPEHVRSWAAAADKLENRSRTAWGNA